MNFNTVNFVSFSSAYTGEYDHITKLWVFLTEVRTIIWWISVL